MMIAQKVTSRWNRPSILLGGSTIVCYAYATLVESNTERNYGKALQSLSHNHSNLIRLPRQYDRAQIEQYWQGRPITVAHRIFDIVREMIPIFSSYIVDFHIQPFLHQKNKHPTPSNESIERQKDHAQRLRAALTRLGPAFIKGGQQLSIRPDLIPPPVLQELQKLCDSVTPVPDSIAQHVLVEELGLSSRDELGELFQDIHLVAAASLGQVYKATLVDTKEEVAIKVQRPDMLRSVSLDLHLLHKLAKAMDLFTSVFTEQAPYHDDLVNTFAEGSYLELDYENEAANQINFMKEFAKRKSKVKIPQVYEQFTSRRVIVTEWIHGDKLANASEKLIQKLIPVGVELFLVQLLDIGFFHADPHPGNLYVTTDGELCLLDFGLIAEIDAPSMHAMTAAIVHLLIGDFDALISQDAKEMGFLPQNLDTTELQPILKKILTQGLLESGSNLHDRKRKLLQISNELNEVFFKYPFSVPPFFALITRGLGLLEGIALSGDPDFDIFQASYPYARRRAVEIFGQHGINQMKRRMTLRSAGTS